MKGFKYSCIFSISGYPITDAMIRVDMGGRDITNHLATLLRDNDHDMKPMEVVRLIKEKACSVAQDFVKQSELQEKESFELPDGEVIELGNERFACAELLFNPSTDSLSDKIGVHEVLYKSIMKTNIDIRKDLYGNIVLSGGSTLFPGFLDRLSKEIVALVPPKAKITINADPGRKYSTWLGGSVLASLSSFNRLLISKDEFEEVGPSILITK
jgi:actin